MIAWVTLVEAIFGFKALQPRDVERFEQAVVDRQLELLKAVGQDVACAARRAAGAADHRVRG